MIDPALTGLAAVCCCGVGLRGLVMMRSPTAVERRELAPDLGADNRRRGPTRQVLDLLGARLGPALLARMSDARRTAIRRKIDLAGRPGGLTVERYAEIKAGSIALSVAAGICWAVLLRSWLIGLMLGLLGSVATDMWISRVGRHRQSLLERELPDFIDILAITVRAGSGYRAALDRVATSLSGPAAEEIERTLHELDLGATRREAFEALRARNNSPTLDSFVAAQLQAEELGVPLSDALAHIAADTRRMAAQEARRRAHRATPRISLIAATLLLPATMLLIVVGLFISTGTGSLNILG
ncbi:MAG: type II secretion system F family protein [Solirubrobacterales bacterium]|nr:type II secretion system F family protein [Solirubrobacterales bacterium]MBV9472715.1 type II secretion system F family protein [Solirubrobacterales bacterium]